MTARRCLHCGIEAVSSRSSPDHRRFFKVIAIAFYIWPESHYFQPESPENLRAWLIAHTDHSERSVITLPDFSGEGLDGFAETLRAFVEECAKPDNLTRFGVWRGNTFQLATPRSIDWDTVSQKFFNHIRDQVFGLILDVTGVDSEQLLIEYGKLPHRTLLGGIPGKPAPGTGL